MTIYSASFSVAGVNVAATPLVNLKASATDRIKLLEVVFEVETSPSNPPNISLERMLAVGTGAITTAASAMADPADASPSGTLETAWATARPTRLATPAPLRRTQLPLAIGSAWIFDFTNRPLIVPISGGLLLVMLNAAGATLGQFGGSFTWDE